ncbi:MAG: hypothetical protein IPK15_25060 [Verrucomicrobia bacterium]|nr:hypothetical protein [Verrucomicrobiota bacterium]
MTTYDLNDVVRLRVEDVSFFAVLILVSGLGIRLLWNHVAKGLPILPKMSYTRALCLTALEPDDASRALDDFWRA